MGYRNLQDEEVPIGEPNPDQPETAWDSDEDLADDDDDEDLEDEEYELDEESDL